MKKSLDLASTVISPLLLLLLAAGSACAAEGDVVEIPEEQQLQVEENLLPAEYDRQVEVHEQKGGSIGYNFLFRGGYAGRALEYGWLHSSQSGGLFYRRMDKETNLEVDGFYLNENDYHGDLLLDYRGDYRLHLRTESLYHNLDRELLFSDAFPFFSSSSPANPGDPPLLADYVPEQQDTASARYGVSVVQDRADFRYRLHNFPLHVSLGYWRYVKEGTIQQRFADTSFEGTTNTIYAQARGVDHQTQEGRIGFDSHLGPVDLLYDFKVRYFDDRLPTPTADYARFDDLVTQERVRFGGAQQHNDTPDSRLISHTLKLHNSIDGGLVLGGSYSIDQRENRSELSDTRGTRHAKVYLRNAAGDIAYTPNPEYSFSLKYRRQELNNGSRATLTSSNFADPVQVVKPAMDTTKDLVIASLSYKPQLNLSLVGEYRGEFLERENVSEVPSELSWALPEKSSTHTGSVACYYRPVKGLRSSAHYSYATTDHPSYGASFEKKQEGKLLASYISGTSWGLTAHVLIRRENNDEVRYFLVNYPFEPLSYTAYPLRSRDKRTENSNIGFWMMPLPGLTVGGNYTYLRNRVEQAVLFTGVVAGSEAASEFTNHSHVYGVNASYALSEKADLSLMMQQVRSEAAFIPEATTFSVGSNTSGIQELTESDTVLSTLSARGEYRFNNVVSVSLDYTLRDYDEASSTQNYYNGTAHAIIAGVAAKW